MAATHSEPAKAAAPASHKRFTVPVDVHAILLRPGTTGCEVLLTRRAGDVYATGLLHLPSGHIDGGHEDLVAALIREAAEETGVVIASDAVDIAVVVHHRSPHGSVRIGVFGKVTSWQGEPTIREPHLCSEMAWYSLDDLPNDDMVGYCRAGLDAFRAGHHFAVHFQQPGDPIAYTPATPATPDRLQLLNETDPARPTDPALPAQHHTPLPPHPAQGA